MKQTILALIAMFTWATAAMAQEDNSSVERRRPTQEQMIQRQTDRVSQRYGLNDEQKAKLLELNKKYAGKINPFRMGRRGGFRDGRGGGQQGSDSGMQQRQRPSREQMEAMRKQMTEAREAYNKELKGILTDEQYKTYTDDMKSFMQRAGRRGSMRWGQHGNRQRFGEQQSADGNDNVNNNRAGSENNDNY